MLFLSEMLTRVALPGSMGLVAERAVMGWVWVALVAPAGPVTTIAMRQPVFTPAPQPSGQREMSPVRKPEREWGVKDHNPSYVGPETPTDVKIVVGLLCLVIIIAAIMIGMLVSDMLAAVIVGVVGLLVIAGFLWFSRL